MRRTTPPTDVSVAAPTHTIRFSIRELLIVLAAVACILRGFAIYGVLGASSITLIVGVLLIVSGRCTKRTWVTRAGIALSIPSFCIAGVMMAGWLLFGIGPIYSHSSWPDDFKRMVEIANADTADAKVAGLGTFLDSEHVWRLSLSPEQLHRVVAEYGLVTVPSENVPQAFWRAFPRSWRPAHNVNFRYLSTPGFPGQSRGPDGDHCFTMYDSHNQRIYVWNKSNF